MPPAAVFLAGGLGGAAYSYWAITGAPDRGRRIFAAGLLIAASVYVGLALGGQAPARWLGLEVIGVIVFAALALAGLRLSTWWLAAGWVLHAAWDTPLHDDIAFLPRWYPSACLAFDLSAGIGVAVSMRRARLPRVVRKGRGAVAGPTDER